MIIVALLCKFLSSGLISNAAVLIGIIAGYLLAFANGMVNTAPVGVGLLAFNRSHMVLSLAWELL